MVVEKPQDSLLSRVSKLESQFEELDSWRSESRTRMALDAQLQVYLGEKFDRVNKEIAELKSGLSWAVRIFLGAIIVAVATFLVRGGFNIG